VFSLDAHSRNVNAPEKKGFLEQQKSGRAFCFMTRPALFFEAADSHLTVQISYRFEEEATKFILNPRINFYNPGNMSVVRR
jgi:hypothetical protein